jgi:hypothetical protein
MAKPVAADVPGALRIEAAGKLATKKQRCFLVDYQLPTDPHNIEVAARIMAVVQRWRELGYRVGEGGGGWAVGSRPVCGHGKVQQLLSVMDDVKRPCGVADEGGSLEEPPFIPSRR